MGDWKPEVHENVDGRNVYFWIVPAKVNRPWQVEGPNKMKVTLDQKYQFFTGKADVDGKSVDITDGKLKGTDISFTVGGQTYTGKAGWQHHQRRQLESDKGLSLAVAAGSDTMRSGTVFDAPQAGSVSLGTRLTAPDDIHGIAEFRRAARKLFRRRWRPDDGRRHLGIGIFQDTADRRVQRAERCMSSSQPACWVGVGTLIGALVYAELAAGLPVHGRWNITFSPAPMVRRRLPVRVGADHRDSDRRDCRDLLCPR